MGIIDGIREDTKKIYKIEIKTQKLKDIKQIITEFNKKFKKIIEINKISLHIEIEYWENKGE